VCGIDFCAGLGEQGRLNLTELAVANHKYFVVQKLREAGRSARVSNELLSAPELD